MRRIHFPCLLQEYLIGFFDGEAQENYCGGNEGRGMIKMAGNKVMFFKVGLGIGEAQVEVPNLATWKRNLKRRKRNSKKSVFSIFT